MNALFTVTTQHFNASEAAEQQLLRKQILNQLRGLKYWLYLLGL